MFQLPALVFSLIIATVYGLLFYLWQGRTLRDLLFFWLAAVVGFASGQVVGMLLDVIPWTVGQVHIAESTLLALLFLVLARWLRQEKEEAP